jgi:tetratricopeptide (TPR) repeat protein
VADGLEHAHRQGVIHRDIKPSNLLVSPQGRLHLTDFGLARVLEEPGMTVTGEFMGSPWYMSPEQIAAGRAPLDHRTDIYSLGATLYEALTLQPPFRGERRDQIIAQILHKEPKTPRAIDGKIPLDLETICLKAMDKDPDRRYRTAGALAEDLRRYVNRFAIEARRASVPQRAVKWARRHPGLATAVTVALVALFVIGLFAQQVRRANRQLLEEKRRAAIHEAVLAARSGDLPSAERAVEHAEQSNASAADVRLLRGQIALHQLHYAEATRHLEQAVRLLPANVAAHALLAVAYWYSRSWDQLDVTLERMNQLQAKSAEDYLFRGQAVVGIDPEFALKSMDEGVKRGDSLIARILRAEARGRYATLTADPADARLGLENIAIAYGMKPNNPDVLKVSLELHTLAARLYKLRGMGQERQRELDLGENDMRALTSVQTAPAAMVKGWYWMERGDEDAALREWGRYAEGPDDEARQWLLDFYVPVLYQHRQFTNALALIEQHPHFGMTPERCFVTAELPDGPERAYALWKAAPRGTTDSLYGTSFDLMTVLQLLGRPEEAAAGFRALQPSYRQVWRNGWFERLLDYELDRITEQALLAIAGKSQWNLCQGHYYIGLRRLSEGDRAGARMHFRESITTPVVGFDEYEWSQAFLSRIDADSNWPPWIFKK